MTNGLLQIALYLVVLTALAVPLGRAMAALYERPLGRFERLFHRAAGVRPEEDMTWQRYALAVLVFNGAGILFLYALQRLQGVLPLSGAGFAGVSPEVALDTAVSFTSNTNWQAYGGETTMSHGTQMLGLTVQNFLSAATGMSVLVALIRGFTRQQAGGIGSFWVDLVRSTLFVLLPLSLVRALFTWRRCAASSSTTSRARVSSSPSPPSATASATSDEGDVPFPSHLPARQQVTEKERPLRDDHSGSKSPEPPKSLGKSLNLGRPSRTARTFSA